MGVGAKLKGANTSVPLYKVTLTSVPRGNDASHDPGQRSRLTTATVTPLLAERSQQSCVGDPVPQVYPYTGAGSLPKVVNSDAGHLIPKFSADVPVPSLPQGQGWAPQQKKTPADSSGASTSKGGSPGAVGGQCVARVSEKRMRRDASRGRSPVGDSRAAQFKEAAHAFYPSNGRGSLSSFRFHTGELLRLKGLGGTSIDFLSRTSRPSSSRKLDTLPRSLIQSQYVTRRTGSCKWTAPPCMADRNRGDLSTSSDGYHPEAILPQLHCPRVGFDGGEQDALPSNGQGMLQNERFLQDCTEFIPCRRMRMGRGFKKGTAPAPPLRSGSPFDEATRNSFLRGIHTTSLGKGPQRGSPETEDVRRHVSFM